MARAGLETEEVILKAVKNPRMVEELLSGLSAPDSSKLARAKALNLLSERHPESLYLHYDFFVCLLDDPHRILKWNAIIILGNLAGVDSQRRFDTVFSAYFRHLRDGDLITAANLVGAAGKIARARPDLAGRITSEILDVEVIPLPTSECREIARGKALMAFGDNIDTFRGDSRVGEFARKCLGSRRPATRKKAEALIKKLSA